jgi:RNA polymerase sporulation-specific sigma factor
MKNYKEYNDYELIYLIAEGNEEANEILYNKYKAVAELKAKKYYKYASSKGLDFNDLVQEGMIGFSEALKSFKDEKDVKLSTFASLCIERQISSAIMTANRNKHKILNDSISLDYISNDTEKPLIEFISEEKESNPLEYIIDKECEKETYQKIRESLTDFENQVLQLKINNFNYKEIAVILDKPIKSIDNTLQRIKNKVRAIIIKND